MGFSDTYQGGASDKCESGVSGGPSLNEITRKIQTLSDELRSYEGVNAQQANIKRKAIELQLNALQMQMDEIRQCKERLRSDRVLPQYQSPQRIEIVRGADLIPQTVQVDFIVRNIQPNRPMSDNERASYYEQNGVSFRFRPESKIFGKRLQGSRVDTLTSVSVDGGSGLAFGNGQEKQVAVDFGRYSEQMSIRYENGLLQVLDPNGGEVLGSVIVNDKELKRNRGYAKLSFTSGADKVVIFIKISGLDFR